MTEHPESVEAVAHQVRAALETADLSALSDVLDPNVRWGPPGDPSPPCQTREQVIAWYSRAKESGATAQVSEIVVLGNRILVGLAVTGTRSAAQSGGQAARWQLLTVRAGLVVDIVGFDQRSETVAHAEVADE